MNATIYRFTLALCMGAFLWACEEPVASVVFQPSDCGYQLTKIPYSDPAECKPKLATFSNPSAPDATSPKDLPDLPTVCDPKGSSRIAYLDNTNNQAFFLHVYKGIPGPLTVEVFGQETCGRVEPVTECLSVTSVAARFEIEPGTTAYSAFFVRITVDEDFSDQFSPSNFVSLAAYEEAEPRSAGSIRYQANGGAAKGMDQDTELRLPPLPFSCDGISFQRVLLNACEADQETLKEWVDALGIPPSETYYGKMGNVVIFDVPPGMDPHTTGGSAAELRGHLRGTGGTVEPDFIINLFNPRDPSQIAPSYERLRLASDDQWLQDLDIMGKEYFEKRLPEFRAPTPASDGKPLIATIIDSGVDVLEPNASNWGPLTYEGAIETEFVKPGRLGFDFIAKDFEPNDLTPHGSYVASSLMGQYSADRNLDLVHMKTFGAEGISSYFGALVSIYEAAAIGSDIINMSWGIDLPEAPEALTCAIEKAVSEGIYIFTSTGNDSLDLDLNPQWPANYALMYPKQVVSTASYCYGGRLEERNDDDVRLLYFANYNQKYASMAGYMTAAVPEFGTGDIIYPLGTSFTTPQVAGSFLNWVARTGNTSLAAWQSDQYSTGPQVIPYVLQGNYLPVPAPGERR